MTEWYDTPSSDLLKMLDELLDDESDRLTEWEVEFIESLSRQKYNVLLWSQKQIRCLIKTWDKVFK